MFERPAWCAISQYYRRTGKSLFTVEDAFGKSISKNEYSQIMELEKIGLIDFTEGENGGTIKMLYR